MILSDNQIRAALANGEIVIEPFREECLGTNSYDVHLGKYLAVYKDRVLDARKHNLIDEFEIGDEGIVLQPGTLYLGVTEEITESHTAGRLLEVESSVGRLSADVHAPAGKGDVGFCNAWSLEISCVQPLRIHPGMPIGQLIYFNVDGGIHNCYHQK